MNQTDPAQAVEQSVNEPDCVQDHEASKLLSLLSTQVRYAMQESDTSVNALTESFNEMIAHVNCIHETVQGKFDDEAKNIILLECDEVTKKMQSTIIAFQFYDKLSQRMQHSSDSLDLFNEQFSSTSHSFNTEAWSIMLDQINAHYTIEHDRDIFKEAIYGLQASEARDNSGNMPGNEEPGDIELF